MSISVGVFGFFGFWVIFWYFDFLITSWKIPKVRVAKVLGVHTKWFLCVGIFCERDVLGKERSFLPMGKKRFS